mmetsp:Transcript_44531/g.123318  ORF Transcript_44531/g.123318 Transcript_44531/m.123318 type:complete len:273 (+) Transcript_44531:499-1317(+)
MRCHGPPNKFPVATELWRNELEGFAAQTQRHGRYSAHRSEMACRELQRAGFLQHGGCGHFLVSLELLRGKLQCEAALRHSCLYNLAICPASVWHILQCVTVLPHHCKNDLPILADSVGEEKIRAIVLLHGHHCYATVRPQVVRCVLEDVPTPRHGGEDNVTIREERRRRERYRSRRLPDCGKDHVAVRLQVLRCELKFAPIVEDGGADDLRVASHARGRVLQAASKSGHAVQPLALFWRAPHEKDIEMRGDGRRRSNRKLVVKFGRATHEAL